MSAADAHHVLNLIDQARYTGRFNDDDRWDLTALRDHLNTILQEQS